ncbi:MAG TPA: YicC/YloC family endoribonuclease [Acidisarcina sp.]|nr:YicC/YloC family endoribonuclease [Acidisarcina sp.]
MTDNTTSPEPKNETRERSSRTQPASSLPVHSMTGFARISGRVTDGLGYTLSLKSVNHRFLDLHMRMPAGADALEMRLRRTLKQQILRGHVEVTLTLDRTSRSEAQYDHALVAAYVAAIRTAARENALTTEPDLNAIFRLPGVFSADVRSEVDETQLLEDAVAAQVEPVVAVLNEMRALEGRALVEELRAGLDRLREHVDAVSGLRQDVQNAYFERLSERLAALVGGSFERDRILQEAALLAERSDIEEEVARLRTHIDHFHSMLDAGGELGKKLDFLLQEMNREANTLLSKTSGVSGNGPGITELGLGMKSEIEKAREQVQNLE